MAVHWNRVTWYSKTIALVLFVALPFIGFYYGMGYGEMVGAANGNGPSTAPVASSTGSAGTGYYQNVAAWQTDRHDDAGLSIAYPIDFAINDNHALTPTTDWRTNSPNVPGLKVLTITIPSAFEPQTNFVDANLTIGYSANNIALEQCLNQDQSGGGVMATSTAVINGIHFEVFHSSDAGAGNIYETTSYRTLHAGACYAVEYTIHSSQIANYPAQYGLKPFDEAQLTDVLDRMVGTFTFL